MPSFSPATRLGRDFFARDALELAPLLLNQILRRQTEQFDIAIRISEVEAYRGEQDPGSHAFRGLTQRNQTMFGPPGHLYCYFTYGMHHALNVVAGSPGVAGGCLLRAGEVIHGIDQVRTHRSTKPRKTPLTDHQLAKGPGNFAQAFAAERSQDGADLCGDQWSLYESSDPITIQQGPRVGVSGPGGDGDQFPWRFWIANDPTVSAYRPATRR